VNSRLFVFFSHMMALQGDFPVGNTRLIENTRTQSGISSMQGGIPDSIVTKEMPNCVFCLLVRQPASDVYIDNLTLEYA